MRRPIYFPVFFFLACLSLLSLAPETYSQTVAPDLNLYPKTTNTRTVTDTVYEYASGLTPRTVTVGLRLGARGDNTYTTLPLDLVFACDLSGSMRWDMAGSATGTPWRLTLVHQSTQRFIDSLIPGTDRVGILGWTGDKTGLIISDTLNQSVFLKRWLFLNTNLPLARQWAHDSLYIDGYDGVTPPDPTYYSNEYGQRIDVPGGEFGGTPLFASTMCGLRYLRDHGDTNHVRVLIVLTDGVNNDGVQLAMVKAYAQDSWVNRKIRTFMIGFSSTVTNASFYNMDTIARAGGGQAYQSTSQAQLDSIFTLIRKTTSTLVATAVGVNSPMLQDVLPAQLTLSGTPAPGPGNTVAATFTSATVGAGLTQLKWAINQVLVKDSIVQNYQMGGVTPGLWDIHVTKAINPTYYSRAYYNNYNGNLRDKEFPAPHKIFVLNAPGPEDISIDAVGGDRQVSVTVDLSRLTFSAAQTVYLYWSPTAFKTTGTADTTYSYALLAVPGQNTVIIPNLQSNTKYYFTVSFENVKGVRSIIDPAQNGDTARTTANQNIPLNYLNLTATATATDSITLSFASSSFFNNDITQIGIWWSTTGYPMDPLARTPDRTLYPASGSVSPPGSYSQTINLGNMSPSTVYYFSVSNKNSDNWAVIGTGAYPRNRDTAQTLTPAFLDTLRRVYIREQGEASEAPNLRISLDSMFVLESRGTNSDFANLHDWAVSGSWSYVGFGGVTVPQVLKANDSTFNWSPGTGSTASFTRPDSGYIIFTFNGIDPAGIHVTKSDSVRIVLTPGKPARVHITSRSAWRTNPTMSPAPTVGSNVAPGGLVDTLMGVRLDRFGNFSDTVPVAAGPAWSLAGSGVAYISLAPTNQTSSRLTKVDNPVKDMDTAYCILSLGVYGTDTVTVTLMRSSVVTVVFVQGTGVTQAWVEAHWAALVADTLDTVYTGMAGPEFSAWAKRADSVVIPINLTWNISTVRNQSAYNNTLTFPDMGGLRVPGDYKWASSGEDKITVNYSTGVSRYHWLIVKPGIPWVAVRPPDTAVSADAGLVLDLKLPTTDYGVAGQWYTTLPVAVLVHIKVIDSTGRVVAETDVPVNFTGGQGTYSLPGLDTAGTYQVIVSGIGTIIDPAGNVNGKADTTEVTIVAGAPYEGRVAWIRDNLQLWVAMAEVKLEPGLDSAFTNFQLYLFDRHGNMIDTLPGYSTKFGAPALWSHDGVRADSGKTHRYGVGRSTPNDTVTVTASSAGITASILVRQILPVYLKQVAFYDADLDGRVDSLRLSFNDLAEVEWSSFQLSGIDFGPGEVQAASGSGAVRDSVWAVSLEGARLGYGTSRIPVLIQLTDPTNASFLNDSVRYTDRAAPAIIGFEIFLTHCGENQERDRVTAVFSEKLCVRLGSGIPVDFESVDTKDLLFALFEVYDGAGVQLNPWSADCGALRQADGCPALYPNIFDAIAWRNVADTALVIDLVPKRLRGHNLLADVSRLGFKSDAMYYISDSAENRLAFLPDGSHAHRTVLKLGAVGAVSVACQVTIVNTGSVAATAGVVQRDPVTGAITYIGSGYASGMTYVEARDIDRNMLFAPLAGGVTIDQGILTDPARREELRQLLLQKKLGFYADIIVYDLIGQVTYHITYTVLPTDFVNESSLENQVAVVLATNLYQQTVNYDYASLNEQAKKKLLGWDFRNDKGRPVAKGAYVMRMFFRNSWVMQQEETGRQLVFEGPVVHKGSTP